MAVITSIEMRPAPEAVYDPCCSAPHSYVSNGFVSHNCVVLWDEVEKMFSGDDNSTQQVLSIALWWLSEHSHRVLTVMTCNNISDLPPELYRPGRIDEVIEVVGLKKDQALEMAAALADTFDFDAESMDPYEAISTAVTALFSETKVAHIRGPRVAQGRIVQAVVEVMKTYLLPDE